MSFYRSFFCAVFCLGIFTDSVVVAQIERLKFKSRGDTIQNTIDIKISSANYEKIKEISGQKIHIRNPLFKANGTNISAKEIHTRGNTTLHFRRKSFSISLDDKASLYRGSREEQ